MSTMIKPQILTAVEYSLLPDDGRFTELVCGRIVEMNRPFTSHEFYLIRISSLIGRFVEQHGSGRLVGGNAEVITQRDPDSVRGADLAFYSYQRVPRGPLPKGYWPASPEFVIEIRSKTDRWKDIVQKVAEYLIADVLTVAVVDPESQRVHVFSADQEVIVLNATDLLTFPDVLPGFQVAVSRLFEQE